MIEADSHAALTDDPLGEDEDPAIAEELAQDAAPLVDRPLLPHVQTRRAPLTREQEAELGSQFEAANRALLAAVARSTIALGELVTMVQEIQEGTLGVAELTLVAPEDEQNRTKMVEDLLGAAQLALLPHQGPRPVRAGEQVKAARTCFVETALQYRLGPRAVDRVVETLAAAREGVSGSNRRGIDDTLRAVRRSRKDAERAKATFIEANLGLAVWMAKKRTYPGMALDDLVQEASLGLMRAVEKFDHRRGIRFSTYAAWWVRHAINRALSDQSRTIRLPVHLIETKHRVARIKEELRQEAGRVPTEAELSHRSGVPADKIRVLESTPREPVSIDTPVRPDGDTRLGDLVAEPHATSPVDEISAKHVGRRLRDLLGTLPPREALVLRLRFGIDQPDCLTLEQIGRRLSVSRERIRQLEGEALSKLRARAANEDLDSHLAS